MFRIVSAVDLALGAPSVLIPVFLNEKTNIPYAQVMDEYLMIEEFLPFFSVEEYPCVTVETKAEFVQNGPGAIIFRDVDLRLHCGTIEEVYRFLDLENTYLESAPLLKLQLLRLVPASYAKQYDAVLTASHFYFQDAVQKAAWSDAALEMIQNNDQIWKAINAKSSALSRRKSLNPTQYEGLEYEALFELLSTSIQYDGWESLWFKLFEMRPNDERLLIVAQRWIFFKFSPGEECISAFNVFCAVVDRMDDDHGYEQQFADFLLEHTASMMFFSDSFPAPFRTKKKILSIIRKGISAYDYRDLIIFLLTSNYFDSKDTKILGLELAQNLETNPTKESSTDIAMLKSILQKVERYRFEPDYAYILKTIGSVIRSRSERFSERSKSERD